ncbi:MAG TPA: hypothetical protein ENH97_02675 [bacterium]|nr:hypothetical protein [bacterium]
MRGVNLLPPEIAKRKKFARKRQMAILLGGTIVALIFFSYLSLFSSVKSYQKGIKEKERLLAEQGSKWKELQGAMARVERIEKDIKALEERIRTVQELTGGELYYWETLRELGHIIPEKVWLREFILNPQTRKLSLKGSASSDTLIAHFLAALETSPYFRGVELKETKKSASGDYKDFELTCIPQGKERK